MASLSSAFQFVPQPYSMGPLLGWDPWLMSLAIVSPAVGTLRMVDTPERDIAMTFIAPLAVQRAHQKQGGHGVLRTYPKGIERVNPKLAPSPTIEEIRNL